MSNLKHNHPMEMACDPGCPRWSQRDEIPPAASTEVSTYVDKGMFTAAPIDDIIAPRVVLLSATPDPLGSVAAMCRMYVGEPTLDLGDISDRERRKYWEQVQKTHLKAPLEAIDLHFFIEGVTRAFTHQQVRQRTAVYAQESMRFAVKEKIAARPGPLVNVDRRAREIWDETMELVWERYNSLIANGIPAEEARGLLPHDTLTRLNYKTNLRNLIEHAGNRLCTQAQFEWRSVFIGIANAVGKHESRYRGRVDHRSVDIDLEAGTVQGVGPVHTEYETYEAGWQWELILDSDIFKPVCFSLGHCPFTADFDRGCTIRDRVEDGKFDEIDRAEYMTDPTAGWVR